jgi:hypothetical protein
VGKYWEHSEETKERIAAALRGTKRSEETKQKMSEAHVGLTPTEETRRKISASGRVAQNRPGVAAKKGGPNTGRSGGRRAVRYTDPNTIREAAPRVDGPGPMANGQGPMSGGQGPTSSGAGK